MTPLQQAQLEHATALRADLSAREQTEVTRQRLADAKEKLRAEEYATRTGKRIEAEA